MKNIKRYAASAVLAGALAAPALASPASAARPIFTGGLVNVTVVDVLTRNNVGLGVAANIAANVCVGDVNVAAVIAAIHDTGSFTCNPENTQGAPSVSITQSQK